MMLTYYGSSNTSVGTVGLTVNTTGTIVTGDLSVGGC